MRIEWTENAATGLQTLFSSWFSPLGPIASSLMIQKSSRPFSRSLRVSLLTYDISVNCSIRINFACFVKLWPCILKWLHAGIAFQLLTSFLWLFSPKLKGYQIFERIRFCIIYIPLNRSDIDFCKFVCEIC